MTTPSATAEWTAGGGATAFVLLKWLLEKVEEEELLFNRWDRMKIFGVRSVSFFSCSTISTRNSPRMILLMKKMRCIPVFPDMIACRAEVVKKKIFSRIF